MPIAVAAAAAPPPLPPLPAFPPSPPPTCEDDGNPVQRLAAGAVAGAFAAAAIYGRAPTKRTRNVKTQTPPQPYVPPPPPSRHCQTDLPRDQECQTAPLPPPPPNSIEREMQTVPTTYYFDAGAQTTRRRRRRPACRRSRPRARWAR